MRKGPQGEFRSFPSQVQIMILTVKCPLKLLSQSLQKELSPGELTVQAQESEKLRMMLVFKLKFKSFWDKIDYSWNHFST